MTKQETLARKLARKWINKNRHDSGYPPTPIRSLHSTWWNKYGTEFMEKAAVELAVNKLNKGK
jgi:hypothetical protein